VEYSQAIPPESAGVPPESTGVSPESGVPPEATGVSPESSAPVWEVPPATGTPVWEIPPAGEAAAAAQDVEATDRPEIAAGLAFVGGLVAAVIVRRLAS